MYVTDIPVVDRITDPWEPVGAALIALYNGLSELPEPAEGDHPLFQPYDALTEALESLSGRPLDL
jgi:hypothetical protein